MFHSTLRCFSFASLSLLFVLAGCSGDSKSDAGSQPADPAAPGNLPANPGTPPVTPKATKPGVPVKSFELSSNGSSVHFKYEGNLLEPELKDGKLWPYRWTWKDGATQRLATDADRVRLATQDLGADHDGILKRVQQELEQAGPLLPNAPKGWTLPKNGRKIGEQMRISRDGAHVLFIAGRYDSGNDRYWPLPEDNIGILFDYETATRKTRPLSQIENNKFIFTVLSGDGSTAAVITANATFGMEGTDDRSKQRLFLVPTNGDKPLLVPVNLPNVGANSKRIECQVGLGALSFKGERVVFALNGDFSSQACLYDRASNKVTLVSAAADGSPGTAYSGVPSISGDGQVVAFDDAATNLATPSSKNREIYLYQVSTGSLRMLTCTAQGGPPNGSSHSPRLNQDGSVVAFLSLATNLKGAEDVVVGQDRFLVVYSAKENQFWALRATK